jgi:hypothetical protein
VLRIVKQESGGRITFRRFSKNYQEELSGGMALDKEECEAISSRFSKKSVYSPLHEMSREQQETLDALSLDGDKWIIETFREGRYTYAEVEDPLGYRILSAEERAKMEREFGFRFPDVRELVHTVRLLLELVGLPLYANDFFPLPVDVLPKD